MNFKYKFKIDSLLEFWGIPARIYFMTATLSFLIPFYLIGFLTVRMICRIEQVLLIEYIYYRSLIVVGRQISLWKVIPFIPIGKDMKNLYPFFLFPPKYKLDDYIIHKEIQ